MDRATVCAGPVRSCVTRALQGRTPAKLVETSLENFPESVVADRNQRHRGDHFRDVPENRSAKYCTLESPPGVQWSHRARFYLYLAWNCVCDLQPHRLALRASPYSSFDCVSAFKYPACSGSAQLLDRPR